MIFTNNAKTIRVMFTPFRDGLQSAFGGKVRFNDFLSALKASVEAGIKHFEFGGGARYQAPFFYLNENPFEIMAKFRETVGPDVDLQILTRSVSGVTLTTQSLEALQLQAKLMKKYGTTIDRNFDYMNDVRNLIATGKPIVDSGMHHQCCIALMGLPFHSDKVHTAEFYINIGKQILSGDVQVDSICLKDASGTTDPKTIYDTAVGLRKIMPPEMPLWLHTHDTASTAVACYMAGIEGGCDGVDLSIRPLASGTVQPDVRSLAHCLKGTGYKLDIDIDKLIKIETALEDGLQEYDFNPTTTTADARVLGFPMPGGAIGPNVHMMAKAGILEKYSDVLAEFPVVVEAGGAWTSVTPGSQQYWLQAFNNVLYGRWEKIESGYGRAILGYFGKTPLAPDPKVVEIASKQLNLPVFNGDPLLAAPDNISIAKNILNERKLPINDENTFLVVSAIVPGKSPDANEGVRFLEGNAKISVPLKEKPVTEQQKTSSVSVATGALTSPVITKCTIEENGSTRTFLVTIEPSNGVSAKPQVNPSATAAIQDAVSIYSPFGGSVEVMSIKVKVGDRVKKGQAVASIEAMKAEHDIKAPRDGVIASIEVRAGEEVDSSRSILTIQ